MNSLPAELKLDILHRTTLFPGGDDALSNCLALAHTNSSFHRFYTAKANFIAEDYIETHLQKTGKLPYYRLLALMRTEKRSSPEWVEDGVEDREAHLQGRDALQAKMFAIVEEEVEGRVSLTAAETLSVLQTRRTMHLLLADVYLNRNRLGSRDPEARPRLDPKSISQHEISAVVDILRKNSTFRQLGIRKLEERLRNVIRSRDGLNSGITSSSSESWFYRSATPPPFDDPLHWSYNIVSTLQRGVCESECMATVNNMLPICFGRLFPPRVDAADAVNLIFSKVSLSDMRWIYTRAKKLKRGDEGFKDLVDFCCAIIPYAVVKLWSWAFSLAKWAGEPLEKEYERA